MKTRFVQRPQGRHGPIKRIVGTTPMMGFYQAWVETLEREAAIACGRRQRGSKLGKVTKRATVGGDWSTARRR